MLWFTLCALVGVACRDDSTPHPPASPAAGAGGAAGAVSGTSSAGAGGSAGSSDPGGTGGEAGGAGDPVSILVFSKTGGYPHVSIPAGIAALTSMANTEGWQLTATADAGTFTDTGLSGFDVLLFFNTSDEVLDVDQQAAFERYIRTGKSFVGIHSASATESDWLFYRELVGAHFREHPDVQTASITVEDSTHPITQGLPTIWTRTDEWYGFETNPRASVNVLLSLDESSYAPGASAMGGDHPIAWTHEYEGTRVFYTALGHTEESYSEPLFLTHVAKGIAWAAGR
jgi:cytochrome c